MFRTRLPLFASLISATFIASLFTANAATIAGTTCPKVNATKTVSKIKYTCVKSGKKLVWNKGVAIKTTPTPEATKSAEAIPTSTITAVKPQTPKPTPTLVIDPIRVAAFNSAHSYKCGTSHTNINFTREVGPNFPSETSSLVDQTLLHDLNCFNDFFDRQINLRVFYLTQTDDEFVSNRVIPSINPGDVDHMKSLMADMKAGKWGQGGMAGGFVNWGPGNNYISMVIHVTAGFKWTDKNSKLVTHEFTHVMQQSYRSKNRNSGPDGWYQQVPGYMAEGGADALGFTFEAQTVEDLDQQIKANANDMSHDPESSRFRNVASENEMLARMNEVVSPKADGSYNMQYPVGAFIGEYIIGKYGFDQYLQLIKSFGVYTQFNDNLLATLGLSQEKLFADSVGYVYAQWRASIKN